MIAIATFDFPVMLGLVIAGFAKLMLEKSMGVF